MRALSIMFNMIHIADRVKNSSLISKGVACLSTLKTSILVLFLLAFVGIGFSSCNQSEDEPVLHQEQTFTATSSNVSQLRATRPAKNFNSLVSTGNGYQSFARGTYAVEIFNRWGGKQFLQPKVLTSPQGEGTAYVAMYKYDGNHKLLERRGPTKVDSSDSYPLGSTNISGDEYVVLIFNVEDSGEFMCWF